MLYIASVLAPYGYNYFNLFLKELKREEDGRPRWSVEEVNTIPILGNGVNVVFGEYLTARSFPTPLTLRGFFLCRYLRLPIWGKEQPDGLSFEEF